MATEPTLPSGKLSIMVTNVKGGLAQKNGCKGSRKETCRVIIEPAHPLKKRGKSPNGGFLKIIRGLLGGKLHTCAEKGGEGVCCQGNVMGNGVLGPQRGDGKGCFITGEMSRVEKMVQKTCMEKGWLLFGMVQNEITVWKCLGKE